MIAGMPYNPRTEDERAALEARARALREAGLPRIEVSSRVGVPAPTLFRWAAENGWRGHELRKAGSDARAKAAREATKADPAFLEARKPAPLTELAGGREAKDAAARAVAAAVHYAEAGDARRAEAALKIAQRFLAIAEELPGADGEPSRRESDREDARERLAAKFAELKAKFTR